MRVVFMGTPQIAADCLSRLIADGFDLVGVYTKPDMPKNRGMKLAMSEVKEVALAASLPVYQPATFRDDAAVEELRALRPDVIAVVGLRENPAAARAGYPKARLHQHPHEHPACAARLGPGAVGHSERSGRDRRDGDVPLGRNG